VTVGNAIARGRHGRGGLPSTRGSVRGGAPPSAGAARSDLGSPALGRGGGVRWGRGGGVF